MGRGHWRDCGWGQVVSAVGLGGSGGRWGSQRVSDGKQHLQEGLWDRWYPPEGVARLTGSAGGITGQVGSVEGN